MSVPSRLLCVSFTLFLTVTISSPAIAQLMTHTEDFSTTAWLDPINTTAVWDTVAAELRLPPYAITSEGSVPLAGASAVVREGAYAYVTSTAGDLEVVDLHDMTHPMVVGSFTTLGFPTDLAVSGDLAFVTAGPADLYVIDISHPEDPQLVKYIDTPGNSDGIEIAGDYAFVSTLSGISVYDIRNPANPTEVGSYDTAGSSFGSAVAGHYLYVAVGSAGLLVLDVGDPASPSFAGSVDTPGEAWRVSVSGHRAYVADKSGGVQIVDVTDPSAPTILGSYDTPGDAYDVALSGQYAYVADQYAGVHAIDVGDPGAPAPLGSFDTPGQALAITIEGPYAFVADGPQGLRILRITGDVMPPRAAGHFPAAGGPTCLATFGTSIYLAGGSFDVFDVPDPLNPTRLGGESLPGYPEAVALFGNYAYFATSFGNTLSIFEISDPSSPVYVPPYASAADYNDVVISGNRAFIAQFSFSEVNGLKILDISDPANPAIAGTGSVVYSEPLSVDVAGNYAYMAVYRSGLVVFDISDIASPDSVAAVATGSDPIDGESGSLRVVVEGDYAYVGDRWTGIAVVDVSDPRNPFLAGSVGTPDRAEDMFVSGTHLIVACGFAGLVVYDISAPAAPVFLGSLDTPAYAEGVTAFGDFVFIADGLAAPREARIAQVYDRTVDPARAVVQSLSIPQTDPMQDFKIETVQADSIRWEISADGGTHWQDAVVGAGFEPFVYPGRDLRWRATLAKTQPGEFPTCSDLVIESNPLVAVLFRRLSAVARADGVELTWDVHSDPPLRGFHVYRRRGVTGSYVQLTAGALVGPAVGRYVDEGIELGREYQYRLGAVDMDGSESLSRAVAVTPDVHALALRPAYPNPFNPSTTISFLVPQTMRVRAAVYDVAGTLVTVLVDETLGAGRQEVVWDGSDGAGRPVSSGVYFLHLQGGGRSLSQKVVLAQ